MRLIRLFILGLLAAGLIAPVTAPAAAAPQAQSTNLIVNGGFEAGGGGSGAASWVPWWTETAKPADGSFNYAYKPNWNLESLSAGAASVLVYAGNSAQRIINNWDPWQAGVRQVVDAPAGSQVRLTAYGRLWASNDNWPSPSDGSVGGSLRVGIEPNGSDNQFANTVVWSGSISPHDTWQAVSVEATVGASGRVGVFLSASYWGYSRQFLAAYFDEASLVVVSATPASPAAPVATAGPQPTSPPAVITPFLTPTPGPDGNIVYVVQAGDTLWRIASITGLTVDQLRAMNGLTGDIISVGQRLIIGQGQAAQPTATLEPTTDPNAAAPTPEAGAPTEAAAGTEVASVSTGTACVMLYVDVNGNGRRETNEVLLAGGQFTVVDTSTGVPVQAHTTDGLNEPHCFTDLPVGTYTISSAAPAGYNATTSTTTSLQLEAGATFSFEFGAQPSGSGQEAAPAAASNPRLRTALFGAAGIMFLLLAAGVAGFLVLRRR
jgi:hypothetical protein